MTRYKVDANIMVFYRNIPSKLLMNQSIPQVTCCNVQEIRKTDDKCYALDVVIIND